MSNKNQWVPVEERLPDQPGYYFTMRKGDAFCEASMSYFSGTVWRWSDGSFPDSLESPVEYWITAPPAPDRELRDSEFATGGYHRDSPDNKTEPWCKP